MPLEKKLWCLPQRHCLRFPQGKLPFFTHPQRLGKQNLNHTHLHQHSPLFLKSTRERYTVIAYGKICSIYLAHHLFRKGVESMQRVVSWFVFSLNMHQEKLSLKIHALVCLDTTEIDSFFSFVCVSFEKNSK